MQNNINKDLYEILGVPRGADIQDIKKAYREKARKCHPDVSPEDPDSEHKFKELTFAYEVLSDPEKRRLYDTYGIEGLRRGAGVDFNGFGSISDLFDIFFGGGFTDPFGTRRARRSRSHGRDMELEVTVSLGEVLEGADKLVELRRRATCEECGGTGLKPGSEMRRCSVCGGTGQIRTSHRSLFGTFVQAQPCRSCGGSGEVIEEPCPECDGEGLRWVTEELKVSVPAGVEGGDRLRIRGKGEGGVKGGEPGDLYVYIDVETHPVFSRSGKDLYTTVRVDMIDAALGKRLELDTLDGSHQLKIPQGTQPGDVLKVKGKGLPPRYGGRRGNMYVEVEVHVPTRLNAEQKRLLEELRRESGVKAER